ncbi:LacI family DNA-binding transcriptional regulator [Microbacterium lacus]|uniref:LacI family DNA-binding transcriptional regulator n=1 Tax=Microbacterium lacus TaxID=415217 RepID=A0ABP4RWA1_9MICO
MAAGESDTARRATVRDVARLAGVSLGSVSNYLSGQKTVATGTRGRIEAAITQLNFVPNMAVRVMRGAPSHALAFLVPDTWNPFFVGVARGIEDVAIARGHVVVICNTEGDEAREKHYSQALAEMRVRGAVALATGMSDDTLDRLMQTGASVVFLGAPLGDARHPWVTVDDELGGYLGMRHLLEEGYEDVLFLGGPRGERPFTQRLNGSTRALREQGMPSTALRRLDAAGSSPEDRMQAAAEILALEPRPRAVFCANDQLAVALLSAALREGIRIPEDLAILGYDDSEASAESPIPLSTIRQPQHEIGVAAAELVFDPLAADGKPRNIEFPPELVVRSSTTRRQIS